PPPKKKNRYHTKYVEEVKRIFETYKGRIPDYAHKELVLDT
ncbi:unnamed protein product, partial [Discosporangium mesarthrocarpum]